MKPALGVCYYPEQWPEDMWAPDAARMAAMGLSYVRIGEFAWGMIEPRPGEVNTGWLVRAMDTLDGAGLKVVLGTPTATPPRWMIGRWPDMLNVDAEGRARKFGSRRHYCFSHLGYREECARITRIVAQAAAGHPALAMWQTDNEYGCHNTTLSYSEAALTGFRAWLAATYGDIAALNRAWGTVFWSMQYNDFAQVELPNLTQTEACPSHWMDFRRYSSDQVLAFNQTQVEVIREVAPGIPITHNYMTGHTDFDHFAIGAQMEVASWDSYPLGQLQNRMGNGPGKAAFARQGEPDLQGFYHDLYRSVGHGRMWVMEQQPGPVNWAAHNADPLPGMVRLWTWEAFAHGAECVSFFRWRQAPFAQEQMHAGLHRPDDQPAPGVAEAGQVAGELAHHLPDLALAQAKVAIVFDYESVWAWEIQPQSVGFSHLEAVFAQYKALRELGHDVDLLSAEAPLLAKYTVVFVPALFTFRQPLLDALTAFDGELVLGPRSGSKTPDFHIPKGLPPALSANYFDLIVTRVASLAPDCSIPLAGGGQVQIWFETIETSAEPLMQTDDGRPVLAAAGRVCYLAGCLDALAQTRLTKIVLGRAGLGVQPLPKGLRSRRTQIGTFVFNYSPVTHDLRKLWPDADYKLDGPVLAPAGVALVSPAV